MYLSRLALGLLIVTGVIATSDPHAQVPICHECEEKKPSPPPIPRCGQNNHRPKLQSGQCATTYRCSGHCGSVSIPHLTSKSMDCDYAEVTVGPDGSILDQCCDPPECPNGCPTKPETNDVCVNDPNGCPAIDGSVQRYGGKNYIYHCNSGFCATTISSVSTTDTLKECAEKCSKDPACKMVSYHKKSCTLATTVGSVEKLPGSVVLEPVSQPHVHDSDCSRLHNTRQIIHGIEFQLHCDTRLADPATCHPRPASSYEDCAAQCVSDSHCASATFSAGQCYLSDKKTHPSKQPGSISLEPLTGYGCPYVDWAVKEIGGVRYEYHCNAWLESGGKWTLVHVANEMDCALQCSKNSHCTGISLRGQQCYLATDSIHLKPKGNWVALVPVTDHKKPHTHDDKKKPDHKHNDGKDLQVPECRAAHGHEVKYKGHTYSVDCYRWVGGDGFSTATKHSLADCIKMCADHSNCVALHYLPSQQFCAIHDNIPRVGTQGDFGVAYVRRTS